jgi:hypothetical protein
MSIFFALVKIDRGEFYSLGKGISYDFIPATRGAEVEVPFILRSYFRTPTDLAENLAAIMVRKQWDLPPQDSVFKYSNRLASSIFEWAAYDRLVILPEDHGDPTGWLASWFKEDESRSIKARPFATDPGSFVETGNRYDV